MEHWQLFTQPPFPGFPHLTGHFHSVSPAATPHRPGLDLLALPQTREAHFLLRVFLITVPSTRAALPPNLCRTGPFSNSGLSSNSTSSEWPSLTPITLYPVALFPSFFFTTRSHPGSSHSPLSCPSPPSAFCFRRVEARLHVLTTNPQYTEQGLAQHRYSTNACWMN